MLRDNEGVQGRGSHSGKEAQSKLSNELRDRGNAICMRMKKLGS